MNRRFFSHALSALSFRQILLIASLLIAVVLSATSVHALLALERLAGHSRDASHEAVGITEETRRLAELSLIMERSARQFLVLNDDAFRQRYLQAWNSAREALSTLSVSLPEISPTVFDNWHRQAQAGWDVLNLPRGQRAGADQILRRTFSTLPNINTRLADEGKLEVERRTNAVLHELSRQREVLPLVGAGAVLLALLLAAGFGMLLSRPLRELEAAIGRLGQNRFDEPVHIHGPADVRQLGQQLEWLRQRLASVESDKARFLRQVSHELKTPLASLHEGVALLEDEVPGKLSASQREITGILKQSSMALQRQIEDLLRYNQAAFEAQNMSLLPVDLPALLQQVIEGQRLQLQARGLQVEVQAKLSVVTANADKLSIALGNLLSNAARFSPQDGTIRFEIFRHNGRVCIDCIDQGPGVAVADAVRVFEPFYQGSVQPPGARRGNGIGLSIVREYVQAHGGTVQVLPQQPGAHFRIELPDEV
jgi:two-component system sensor histidine kinase GlrK